MPNHRKDITDFSTACQNLLIETLKHANLLQPVPDGHDPRGNSIPATKHINILDLGFGCGDQTLCLADIWHNASLGYVGLTLSQTQHSVARDRLDEARVQNASNIKVHCADAAAPESWTEEIMADVLALSPRNKTGQTENWVLALDTLYHFSPSRLPILSFAARELKASLMAVEFVDIAKHTFGPLSSFTAKQEAELRMIGLSLGKLRFARRLFAWFDRAEVVRAVIVVARHGKSEI